MEPAEVESLLEIEDSSAEAWFSVFRRLIINRDVIRARGREAAEIVCHALLKKVEDFGCNDKYCVWKIIHMISVWLNTNRFDIKDNFNLHKIFKRYGERTHPFVTIGTCTISKLLQKSLWGSKVQVMRLLLNYGYLDACYIDEHITHDAILAINICGGHAPELVDIFDTNVAYRTELLAPLCRKYINVPDGRENILRYQRGSKRIILAALSMSVLSNRNTNNAEQYVQCLRLLFRAVADPFVEAEEVGLILRFVLFGKDSVDQAVDAMLKDFKRLYPESQGPYRPRSLKHLCRCVIRQKLNPISRLEVFPLLVDHLVLPPSLKMYIMGNL